MAPKTPNDARWRGRCENLPEPHAYGTNWVEYRPRNFTCPLCKQRSPQFTVSVAAREDGDTPGETYVYTVYAHCDEKGRVVDSCRTRTKAPREENSI